MAKHSLGRDDTRLSDTQESPVFPAGPWHNDSRTIYINGHTVLAEIFPSACRNIAQADATERLIAAAPDLHAALQAIVAECSNGYHLIPNRLLVQAREALQIAQEGR